MNNSIWSILLTLACASFVLAQEPPGCAKLTTKKHLLTQKSQIRGKLPKRKVLDLRRKKKSSPPAHREDAQLMPMIASPIYLPQAGAANTAITSSNGYLYVVVGNQLYKVEERTLRTVKVTALGSPTETTLGAAAPKRRRKIVAKAEEAPKKRSTRRRSSKTD